jgi:hypothetical protein
MFDKIEDPDYYDKLKSKVCSLDQMVIQETQRIDRLNNQIKTFRRVDYVACSVRDEKYLVGIED